MARLDARAIAIKKEQDDAIDEEISQCRIQTICLRHYNEMESITEQLIGQMVIMFIVYIQVKNKLSRRYIQ